MDDYQLEKLYINTFAVIAIAIVAAIQFAIIYKFGLKGGIIFAIAFSILFSFGRQVLLSYARGMGDSKGTGPSYEFEMFSSQLLICLGLFAVYSFGMYFYIAYLKTGALNKPVFFAWLVIFVGGPLLYFGTKVIRSHFTEVDHNKNYVKAEVQILHYNELPVFIETLKIKNTTNGKGAEIRVFNQSWYSTEKFLTELNIWDKIRYGNQFEEAERNFIPLNSDQLALSWYSLVEGVYYNDVLNFPFDEFEISKQEDGQTTFNLQLEVLPKGKVYLYTTKAGKRFTYQAKTKVLSEKEKARFVESFYLYHSNVKENTFSDADLILENSRRLKARIEQDESLFNLAFNIKGPGELNSIHFEDLCYWGYDTTYSKLSDFSPRPLPHTIALYFTNTGKEHYIRAFIYFDKKKLFETIQGLTRGNKEMPVEISIIIKGTNKENIEVAINGNNQKVIFSDWEKGTESGD